MRGDCVRSGRTSEIRSENRVKAEQAFGERVEVAAGLLADRDDAVRPWIVRAPARAETARAAEAIGQPTCDGQGQQTGRMAGGKSLAQRIDQALDDFLRAVSPDLMAAMANRGIGDAAEGGVDVAGRRHARNIRQR